MPIKLLSFTNTYAERVFGRRRSYLRCFVFFVVLSILFSILSPYFFSSSNFENVLSASAVIGLLAIGSTFVIAGGEIDLSIASVMALSGTVCASVVQVLSLDSPWLCVGICCGTGAFCGVVTGLLTNFTGAPSFIVSLGMLSVARALAYIVSDGTPIYGLPDSITEWGQGKIVGVPGPILFLSIGAVISFVLLHHARIGQHFLILGDNAFAAKAMGIRTDRLRLTMFTWCGVYAGLAGFVFMARTNAGDPTAGQNYELVAITAVVLGGAKLFGGEATILGTLFGVLCLGALQNGLNLLAVSTYYQVLFVGLVLIGAAFLERTGRRQE